MQRRFYKAHACTDITMYREIKWEEVASTALHCLQQM